MKNANSLLITPPEIVKTVVEYQKKMQVRLKIASIFLKKISRRFHLTCKVGLVVAAF
jgi:hypothetical protein